MLERTKKPPTESIHLIGSPEAINRVRRYALKIGAGVVEDGSVPATDISPDLENNPVGVYLRGVRLREDMTQDELARLTGITRSNISAMENGKRPIGKETARKLAGILNCDYRRFL